MKLTPRVACPRLLERSRGIRALSKSIRSTWLLLQKMCYFLSQIEFTDVILYYVVYGLTKVSVVLFHKRIFVIGKTVLFTNIVLVVISIFMIVSVFVSAHLNFHGRTLLTKYHGTDCTILCTWSFKLLDNAATTRRHTICHSSWDTHLDLCSSRYHSGHSSSQYTTTSHTKLEP
jgi:hypothetical protein